MRVLVACEYSGVVRDAFIARGHDAISCDLLDTEARGPHYKGDIRDLLTWPWGLVIAHPPCTHLAVSGARHFPAKIADGRQVEALDFVRLFLPKRPNIKRLALENPISIISSKIRKPDQIIQPHHFGHREFKATCLWLENLPSLRHVGSLTPPIKGTEEYKAWSVVHRMPPGPDRWKKRSTTYKGIADAMAAQWGILDTTGGK